MRKIFGFLLVFVVGLGVVQAQDSQVEQLKVEVIATRDHDPAAFTQGLVLHEGVFYESKGRYGESAIRQVDPETGAVLNEVRLNQQFFAEGLALVDDETLIQITWKEGLAIVWDRATFEQLGIFFYQTEGWGLCYDGEFLYMSDGSDILYKRDPQYFRIVAEIPVTLAGEPRNMLNELECVGDEIYANVYQTETIVRIDKASGEVTAEIDASGLLTEEERAGLGSDPDTSAVLNGIAYDADKDVFYITGKLWPHLFEVNFVPAD